MKIKYEYDDGGRADAGFKGLANDCFVRAVAIASGRNYRHVYNDVAAFCKTWESKKNSHPRTGVRTRTAKAYLAQRGWVWTATMGIGTGCKVHLDATELPPGTLICRVSRHFAAVVDGVLRDNHDSSRNGKRCVYGYWQRSEDQD